MRNRHKQDRLITSALTSWLIFKLMAENVRIELTILSFLRFAVSVLSNINQDTFLNWDSNPEPFDYKSNALAN